MLKARTLPYFRISDFIGDGLFVGSVVKACPPRHLRAFVMYIYTTQYIESSTFPCRLNRELPVWRTTISSLRKFSRTQSIENTTIVCHLPISPQIGFLERDQRFIYTHNSSGKPIRGALLSANDPTGLCPLQLGSASPQSYKTVRRTNPNLLSLKAYKKNTLLDILQKVPRI